MQAHLAKIINSTFSMQILVKYSKCSPRFCIENAQFLISASSTCINSDSPEEKYDE